MGLVRVPDIKLEKLGVLNSSEKIVPTALEFVDVAGLVKGASKGEGLGNKFLATIRQCGKSVEFEKGKNQTCYSLSIHMKGGEIYQLMMRCDEMIDKLIFFLPLLMLLDAIVHVVRCFEDEDVIHVDGTGRF